MLFAACCVSACVAGLCSSAPLTAAFHIRACRQLGTGPDGTKSFREYPWSPRWGAPEMAVRIHNFVKGELQTFLRLRNAIATAGLVGAAAAAPP